VALSNHFKFPSGRRLIVTFSGFVCVPLPGDRLDELEIPMMVQNNQDRHRTASTVTVDYKHGEQKKNHFKENTPTGHSRVPLGTTTGISAHDRALTARTLASPTSVASDFTRPGHLVPLRYRDGGVLARRGHTECAVDLCLLTDLPPAGVLCEIVNDDAEGTMARRDDCRAFADRWGLKMISVEMLVQYRRKLENGVQDASV
jgi:3,4-dihydroxy-2-butanone 4-phosphate synthase